MKRGRTVISINFAGTDYRLMSRIYSGMIAATAVFAVVLALLLWRGSSLRAQIEGADARLRVLSASEEKIRPVLKEREQLLRDLSAMSGLMEARRFSWTRFLTNLEAAVPFGVALGKVDFNPRDRSLAVDGAAQSPEALRNLMVGLERSRSFRDPLLKHQSMDKGSISFNVGAYYHDESVPGHVQASAQP
jgi:Tfp pilus assembly protein PilN